MEEEGWVSLWLGNFNTEENLNEFLENDFTEDGDELESKFQLVFQIKDYDHDFLEVDFLKNSTDKIENLLKDFSEDKTIIKEFKKVYKKIDIYNSIILIYNFKYDEKILNYVNKKTSINYIGCVKYNKKGL